jgi:protoporphyrinogen oxidase
MAKVVIIGAGLTGLSAAYHLEKRGFTDYVLFEKEKTVGGLCRSVVQDGFTFDYTGHLLHINDSYFRSLINNLVGIENFNAIHRKSFIYSHERYTRYPYQINLYGLPEATIADCIEGFVNKKTIRKKVRSFPEWVQSNFGAGFARHFFLPYQRKIFAYNLHDITASWTGRFVPQTSLREMIVGALKDKTDDAIGYNAHFYYPKQGGIEYWILKLAQAIAKPIITEYCVQSIDTKNKVVKFTNGHEEPYHVLINTMPLDTLLGMLKEPTTRNFAQARKNLKCNSVVNFNLGVARHDLSEKHWIYFPETEYPFYRIGFPHNFADSMAPQGCSSLYGEFAHIGKSKAFVQRTLKQALAQTKKILGIAEHEIVTEKIMHISHAYVIYNFWREQHLPKVHARLQEHDIYSVGRYGEWKYASMQEGVLDGKKIAEQITILPAKTAYYQEQPIIKEQQKEVA